MFFCKTKKNKEKTMQGKFLFCPKGLNNQFKHCLQRKVGGQFEKTVIILNSIYAKGYQSKHLHKGAFREMDFLNKNSGLRYSLASILSWPIMVLPR